MERGVGMATNNVYDVVYEFGNKEMRRDLVIAAAGDEASIKAVLASNGKTHPSGAVKILSIRNANVPAAGTLS